MRIAVLAFVALVATGCMGRTVSGGDGSASAPARTWVFVTLWPQGKESGKDPLNLALWCRGPGGEHGGAYRPITARRACTRLVRAGAKAFKPIPGNAVCRMIYGGPAEARVEGFVAGTPVAAHFSRGDGCEIARWDKLRFLFPGVS